MKLLLGLFFLVVLPLSAQTTPGQGGISVGSGAAPVMAFYLGPQCPVSNTGNCFNTFADTQEFNDVSWTTSNGILTANTAEFTPSMVGMSVMGFASCAGDTSVSFQNTTGTIAPNATPPTVLTYNSPTSITISATPANAQALVSTAPIGGCLIIGHLDDAGFAALSTAVTNATQCPKVFLSAANYFITTPPGFMTANPPACIKIGAQLGGAAGNPGFGTVTLPTGFELEGRGTGNTAIFLATNFPNGDACTHKPTPSVSGTGACFVVPALGAWRDFRLDGGGQGNPTNFLNKTLIYMAVGKLKDFLCMNYGGYEGSTQGIELSWQNQLDIVNNSGCGTVGIAVDSGVSLNVGVRVVVESSGFNALRLLGAPPARFPDNNLQCYACTFLEANTTTFSPAGVVENLGGSLVMFGGFIGTYNGNLGANTTNGLYTYSANTTSGGKLYAEGVTFGDGTGGGSNTNGAVQCTVACTNKFINSSFRSQASAFDITDVAGSNEFDLGGNSFTPRLSIGGTFIADSHALKATCTGVATASSTLALLSSGTSLAGGALTTACTGTTLDKGVPVNGARTLQNLTCTSSATTVSVACTVMTSHNGGAFSASAVTCTMTAAVRCTDGTHSLALADGDFVTVEIVTGAAETGANIKALVTWQ